MENKNKALEFKIRREFLKGSAATISPTILHQNVHFTLICISAVGRKIKKKPFPRLMHCRQPPITMISLKTGLKMACRSLALKCDLRFLAHNLSKRCYNTLSCDAGQPTFQSHPSLIQQDEVTPGVRFDEFERRRCSLLEKIVASMPEHDLHVVIVPASVKKYMTEKIPYVFRQDSDFLYLTGCLEPDSCLVLTSARGQNASVIFLRGKDAHAELWDGPRTGVDQVKQVLGIEKGLPLRELSPFLKYLLKDSNCFIWFDYLGGVNQPVYNVVKDLVSNSKRMESPRPWIHQLRLLKSESEQGLMRKTCTVGSEAIARTMNFSKPGIDEAHLFAKVDYESRMMGAEFLAYPPVVAGGARANTIHYITNNQIVCDGELVLMDAGCQLHGYTSDITRTWPVSACWSDEQRALYQVLYEVQMQCLAEIQTRNSLNQLFHVMCRLLGRGLRELGVFSAPNASDDELAKMGYGFCPHHVSHYLGMDVHDTNTVSRDIKLEPGMVFTVEPGIYISGNNTTANPIYRGLGMRIEDDVLLTESGVEVLTERCPKHPDDVIQVMQNKKSS